MTNEEILTNGPEGWTHVSTSMIDVPPTWLRYEVAGVYSVWMDDNGTNPNPYWREMPNNCIEFPEFIRSRNDIEQLKKANERIAELEWTLSNLDDYLSDKNKFAIEKKIEGIQKVLDCRELNLSQGDIDTIKLIQEQLRKEQE